MVKRVDGCSEMHFPLPLRRLLLLPLRRMLGRWHVPAGLPALPARRLSGWVVISLGHGTARTCSSLV